MNKKRLLLVSCSIILLCMISIVGMTYALFSSSVRVRNHLVAGDLNVELHRTGLEYMVLDSNGVLTKVVNNDPINFSESLPDKNIFGIDSSELKIVPGSYFESTLKLTSDGTCAYDYSITFVLDGASVNELANQLYVTITDPNLDIKSGYLADMVGGKSIDVATMQPGAVDQYFKIRVEFIDDNNQTFDNDKAKDLDVYFDVIIEATQATSATGN